LIILFYLPFLVLTLTSAVNRAPLRESERLLTSAVFSHPHRMRNPQTLVLLSASLTHFWLIVCRYRVTLHLNISVHLYLTRATCWALPVLSD